MAVLSLFCIKDSYLSLQAQLNTILLGSLTYAPRGSQDSLFCGPRGVCRGSTKHRMWKGRTIGTVPFLSPLRQCPCEGPWTAYVYANRCSKLQSTILKPYLSGWVLLAACTCSQTVSSLMTRMLYLFIFLSVASTPHHAGHKSRHLTDVPGRSCLYTGPQPDQEGWHLALQSSTAISLAWAEGLAAAASLETPAIPFAFACSQAESCYQLPQTPGSFPLLTQRLIVASLLTSSSHPLAASPALTTV